MGYYDDDEKEDELNPNETEIQDIEDILEQLNFETVKVNILDQINGNLDTGRDFLGVLLSKINTIMDSLSDASLKRQITDEVCSFCDDISREIISKYNLSCSLLNDIDIGQDVLETLYGFFIQYHDLYVKTFLIEYIRLNKNDIVHLLGLDINSGDITTAANKKKLGSGVNVAIISNIDAVFDYIKYSAPINPIEFVTTIDDGDVVISSMLDYLETYQITGNFITQYLEESLDEDSSEQALNIKNDVQVALYSDQ